MKPFSEAPKCDKCNSADVSRQYHATDEGYKCGEWWSKPPKIVAEHHMMYCRGCGFSWQEGLPAAGLTLDLGEGKLNKEGESQ